MVTVAHRAWQTVLAGGTTSIQIDDTTVAWDYEDGTIWAIPASIWQYIYPGEGTTSTCFGTNCPATNTLASTPTQRGPPSFTYTPPPPHAMTQFTPAPSCLAESNLWIVFTQCFVSSTRPEPDPSWLECILTVAGESNVSNRECHRFSETATVGADDLRTFYSACPAGYSVATSRAWGVFNEPTNAHGEPSPTRTYDATVTNLICCPSGTYDFKYAERLGSLRSSTTVHDGVTHTIQFCPVPECVATSVRKRRLLHGPGILWEQPSGRRLNTSLTPPSAMHIRALSRVFATGTLARRSRTRFRIPSGARCLQLRLRDLGPRPLGRPWRCGTVELHGRGPPTRKRLSFHCCHIGDRCYGGDRAE